MPINQVFNYLNAITIRNTDADHIPQDLSCHQTRTPVENSKLSMLRFHNKICNRTVEECP